MNNLPEYLLADYKFWEKQLTEFDTKKIGKFITTQEVLRAYYYLIDYFHSISEKLHYGIKDFYLIGSAVGRQFTSIGGVRKWNTVSENAATLFYGLNKNHAFSDGNKRTSLLILLYVLIQNGYITEGKQADFEELSVRTAANELDKYPYYKNYVGTDDVEVKTIAHFIRKNTRKEDQKYYSMTYQELETRLHKYDHYFDVDRNYVTIYSIKETLFRKTKIHKITIGFPGWKRQIGMKSLKGVVKACGLTSKNGFDMQILLNGTESMYRLINDYEGPLRRLRDK